ncbi:MAG: hypothetical protein PHT19_15970, partial [Methylococcus sp.]|nr:hypothetical protein [Methylococcus sp.]
TSGRNPNQFGLELIRLRMPYEIFAQLQDLQVPGEYLIDVQLGRGAGDKAQLRVTGLQPGNLLDKARLHELFKLDGKAETPVAGAGAGSAASAKPVPPVQAGPEPAPVRA